MGTKRGEGGVCVFAYETSLSLSLCLSRLQRGRRDVVVDKQEGDEGEGEQVLGGGGGGIGGKSNHATPISRARSAALALCLSP